MGQKLTNTWNKIKWFFNELLKIYSTQDGFFSKKRIESGVAFIVAQWGMITYFAHKYSTMQTSDVIFWASVEFGISGYMVNQIQKEKKATVTDNTTDNGQQQPNNN